MVRGALTLPLTRAPLPAHPACGERVGVRGIALRELIGLLHVSDELQDFYRAWAELLRQLVLQWFRLLDEARFIDILDELHADLFQSRHRLVFEAQGLFRHRPPDLVGGRLAPG